MTNALIIGGGVAGTAAAMALRKVGIDATVYEAHRSTAHDVGATMGLTVNGLAALQNLGAHEAIRDAGFPVPRGVLWLGNGKRLGDADTGTPLSDGTVGIQLRRADLYAILHQTAIDQGIPIEHGKRLTKIEHRGDRVAVHFADGGQSIRFHATDEALRPMGRATSGVLGMRFNEGDELLTLGVVREGTFLLVATDGGYAKRTPIEDYPVQGRGGKGVLTVQYDSRRGRLVGAQIVDIDDELYAITSAGGVIRTSAEEVRKAGRQTKGVRLMNLGEGTTLVAIARSAEEPNGTSTDTAESSDTSGQDNGQPPAEAPQ